MDSFAEPLRSKIGRLGDFLARDACVGLESQVIAAVEPSARQSLSVRSCFSFPEVSPVTVGISLEIFQWFRLLMSASSTPSANS